MKRVLPASFAVVSILVACGGGRIPAVGPDRESGQSGLMDKTFAGSNKCNPKNHERPFVIEWDATDMSQFEALTASDIVFVKYEGCDLKIIDTCKNDSVKGQLGSYRAVDWTSGSVEKIDITNEGELYAKLPLGVATLGARVSAGEAFRMEYFVSGTRSATRPAQYKADLDKIPGCKGVTHFVYAYNLGAFALGSNKNVKGEANATFWGAGAGGSSKYASAAEKKGGLLASCRGESAKEIDTCKTPIRLTLRELEDAENPDAKAAIAPETPDAKNLAGKVDDKIKLNEKAQGHLDSANQKLVARDGKSCLAELDEKDKADPRPIVLSTNPKSAHSSLRARCLMAAGQCDAGKLLARKQIESTEASSLGPEQMDKIVTAYMTQYCQGKMSDRDQLLKANNELSMGWNVTRKEPSVCKAAIATFLKLRKSVKEDDETKLITVGNVATTGPGCLVKAGDCNGAWAAVKELTKIEREETGNVHADAPQTLPNRYTPMHAATCHAKDVTVGISPQEKLALAAHDLDGSGDVKYCLEGIEVGKAAARGFTSSRDTDSIASAFQNKAAKCLAKAGDCSASRKAYVELGRLASWNAKQTDDGFLKQYSSNSDFAICKDK